MLPFAALLLRSVRYKTQIIIFLGLGPSTGGSERLFFSAEEIFFEYDLRPISNFLTVVDWHEANGYSQERSMRLHGKSIRAIALSAVPGVVPGGRCFEIDVTLDITANT